MTENKDNGQYDEMPLPDAPGKHFLSILYLCFGLSYILGIIHVLTLYLFLPSTDGLKNSKFGILALLDPFIVTIMSFACFMIGLFATPIAMVLFWKKDIRLVTDILLFVCVPVTIVFSLTGTVLTVLSVAVIALVTSLFIYAEVPSAEN